MLCHLGPATAQSLEETRKWITEKFERYYSPEFSGWRYLDFNINFGKCEVTINETVFVRKVYYNQPATRVQRSIFPVTAFKMIRSDPGKQAYTVIRLDAKQHRRVGKYVKCGDKRMSACSDKGWDLNNDSVILPVDFRGREQDIEKRMNRAFQRYKELAIANDCAPKETF